MYIRKYVYIYSYSYVYIYINKVPLRPYPNK